MGILEVDGATYHPSPAFDYQRDRLFIRQGLVCSRFYAAKCMENPDAVVRNFELLGRPSPKRYPTELAVSYAF